MFYGLFKDKADVCREFDIAGFDGVVLYAHYDYVDYSGDAHVIFVRDGKFYTVSGAHCSCYGLEGQWEAVEMPLAALRRIAEEGDGQYRHAIVEALRIVDDCGLEHLSEEAAQAVLKLAIG